MKSLSQFAPKGEYLAGFYVMDISDFHRSPFFNDFFITPGTAKSRKKCGISVTSDLAEAAAQSHDLALVVDTKGFPDPSTQRPRVVITTFHDPRGPSAVRMAIGHWPRECG